MRSFPHSDSIVSHRVLSQTSGGILDFGVKDDSTPYSWIQSRHNASATSYNIAINPNGGNVGIGTTTPQHLLTISGSASGVPTSPFYTLNTYGNGNDKYNWGIGFENAGYGSSYGIVRNYDTGNLSFVYQAVSSGANFTSAATNLMSISSTGNVGIGTTSPTSFTLQVKGDVGPDANNTYVLGSASLAWGCLYYNASVLGTCPSDQRLKDNVADLTFGSDPLSQLAGLRLRTFSYKSAPGSTYSGLVAQEVEAVAPELVVTDASTSMKSVKYGDIQWLVISAVQELIAKVTELASTVAAFADHFTTRELTFTRAIGDEIDVNTGKFKTLCVGQTCVTESELQALLRQTGQALRYGTDSSRTSRLRPANSAVNR